MYGRRILILIPHPDDEVVGAALAIRRAVAGGAVVFGLDLTHGCPPAEALWPWARGAAYAHRVVTRRAEAKAAARALGLARIADDGVPARQLRRVLPAALKRAVDAVDASGIDTVWVPAYEGAHADHDAANALAAALRRARPALSVWEFAEYNNAGGRLHANAFPEPRGGTATRDQEITGDQEITRDQEITIALDDDMEGRWKSQMLALYRSESFNLGNITGGPGVFCERFRPLPEHDYSRPPHPGRLHYERYHWLPLRMPQVDFTTGAEVSAALTAFLGGRG